MVAGTYTLRAERTYDYDTSTWLVEENYISPYYEANKEALKTAFGYATNQSRCSEPGTGRSFNFSCSVSGLYASASASGLVYASSSSDGCSVGYNGYAGCYWS